MDTRDLVCSSKCPMPYPAFTLCSIKLHLLGFKSVVNLELAAFVVYLREAARQQLIPNTLSYAQHTIYAQDHTIFHEHELTPSFRSFIFQKKFFWFGSEPIEHKSLTSYLRGEKQQELANKNAAWSSHTGKGLVYFSKKPSEKATPAGVINLVRSIFAKHE